MPFRDWKIVRIVTGIAMRIWAASGAALLAAFVIYIVYGGFVAFLLLLFAVSGEYLFYGSGMIGIQGWY